MLILLQEATGPGETTQPNVQPLTLPQVLIVVFLIAVIALIVFLLIRVGVGSRTVPQGERSWLDYGNFFVVALGIAAIIIGFLITMMFLNRFADTTQALGFLTALFGAIAGLVGTFFGVKASGDARQGAQRLQEAQQLAASQQGGPAGQGQGGPPQGGPRQGGPGAQGEPAQGGPPQGSQQGTPQ
jgi:hypothetical protein